MNPAHKGGNVLHPTQKRILTVRECQVRDQLKQIGNAVPIPLGMALGKELGKALFIMWKKQDAEEARERANSPEAGEMDLDAADTDTAPCSSGANLHEAALMGFTSEAAVEYGKNTVQCLPCKWNSCRAILNSWSTYRKVWKSRCGNKWVDIEGKQDVNTKVMEE
ncbi:hypothetical protein EIP91_010798 [Steccherinum ochraceum]|uniref:DNA (cytosine-5-)-methyltransferase n=1 Tax=Steccherinum ochraceum TaxID=92696 RepID=A0A4V2MUW2_9APHY|nr:hypothetical protein EIP91_010798 [Steccherinum ochraceum]